MQNGEETGMEDKELGDVKTEDKRRVIRVGSRESRLAVEQTRILLRRLEECHPELAW